MRIALLVLLGALPLIELALLIKVGGIIGLWSTLGIILLTALLGSAVLANHGFTVMLRTQQALARGEAPVGPMVDGMFMAAAGLLLIAPGLITDALGLLLLIPPLRRLAAHWSIRRLVDVADINVEMRSTRWQRRPDDNQGTAEWTSPRAPTRDGDGPVIDGDFTRIGERTIDPSRRPPDGQDRDKGGSDKGR